MQQDIYWPEPRAPYAQRREQYLHVCAASSPGGQTTGFFSQLARLELGRAVEEGPIREAVAFVDSRRDCCDFAVAGLLRILYLYRDSPHIPAALIADIEACLLRFKYWWDEPAGDNRRCYHSENHQIIFHSDELLAGQLFAGLTFQNDGKTGRDHMGHALHLIRRWLTFRIQFGFSEWLSNCYFDEDLLALVNLHDFAEQPDVRQRAKLLIDVLLFEMALHSYRGIMGCTHGRTYAQRLKGARGDSSTTTIKLMLGMGIYNNAGSKGAIPLATSTYRCPAVIEAVAADLSEPVLCRERHSLNIEDAPRYGLSYDRIEDGHLYWSIQDYLHPKVIALSQRMSETYGVRLHEDYEARYRELYQPQIDRYGKIIDASLDPQALTEVHIQTYRTSDYMLSCAQDYRPGKPGYQQHIWQATLGLDTVVFTNHPGSGDETSRPNYWAGNGTMPRAVQHQNLLVCIHHVSTRDAMAFSHAYFPRDAFDEFVEDGGWIFGRYKQGFLALFTRHPYEWVPDAQGQLVELRADAPDNIWVCELGTRSQWGTFDSFVRAVTRADIRCEGLDVCYASPSQGRVRFGWDGPLTVNGQEPPLHTYPRFDNPYCHCPFLSSEMVIRRGDDAVRLDFDAAREQK